jgi:hypothetical protein
MSMNNRHRKTLEAIFSEPVPRNIKWRQIERLFLAVGCEIIEERFSRVAFKQGDIGADFHRPHPAKEAKPYQVRAASEFLERLEVEP